MVVVIQWLLSGLAIIIIIKVDRFIEAGRPDIILVRKKKKECVIIDIAVPGDIRTQMKEDRKIGSTRI